MKVAVITRHAISNYGSFLQTYATQYVLRKMGYDSEIIDYIRNDEDYHNIADVLVRKNSKWNINAVRRMLYKITQAPEHQLMGRKFESFRKKYLNLSSRYVSNEELRLNKPEADVYMTGSDQVWGQIGDDLYDSTYFLDFTNETDIKAAYAGSFGKTKFTIDIIDQYKKYLNEYDYLTVREKSAVDLIKTWDINKKVDQVLDPTLLLTADEWTKLIRKEPFNKYILIYQLHNNPQMDVYAKEVSKKMGLPLIRITPSLHHCIRGGKVVFLPDLGDFLAYIKNARMMVTDSFHGTAFAINFGTQFINVLHGETKTRNQSILELTGLENRVLDDYTNFNYINEQIDYTSVHQLIASEREHSFSILRRMLQEIEIKKRQ